MPYVMITRNWHDEMMNNYSILHAGLLLVSLLVSDMQGARRRSVMVTTELEAQMRQARAYKAQRRLQVSLSHRFILSTIRIQYIVCIWK